MSCRGVASRSGRTLSYVSYVYRSELTVQTIFALVQVDITRPSSWLDGLLVAISGLLPLVLFGVQMICEAYSDVTFAGLERDKWLDRHVCICVGWGCGSWGW